MAASSTFGDESFAGGSDRRLLHPLALAYFALAATIVLVAAGLTFFGDPHAGDPVVELDFGNRTASVSPRTVHPNETPLVQKPNGPLTVPPSLVPSTIAQPVYAGRALIADPALIEATAAGPLPRIADNGRTPMSAYAAPVAMEPGKARIALVIGGLGISEKATAAALAGLPPAVTLAFAPYTEDAPRWVGEARKEGHEVLVEVPMEPFDFPDSDPGPHTLRAGAAEDSNSERLVWALTRFTGYTGVTNLLGGRFLSDADSLEPVMTYLTRRGLLFFDNGSATHSAAPDVASRINAPFAQSTTTIDSIQTAMEIDRQLSDLETQARTHGSAAGAGFIYPVTVQRVAAWAQGLSERGFVLVPASAIVAPSKTQ
jgi:polysaccharide deacetylase 2 family uncharacterized protein YibQ